MYNSHLFTVPLCYCFMVSQKERKKKYYFCIFLHYEFIYCNVVFSAGKQYGNFKSMNIKKPSMSDGNAIKAIGCSLLFYAAILWWSAVFGFGCNIKLL